MSCEVSKLIKILGATDQSKMRVFKITVVHPWLSLPLYLDRAILLMSSILSSAVATVCHLLDNQVTQV